ncbi:homeobox protein PKNOX2-like [Littorina saxatilis]|uniref:homeobox protein PKNOX2-like n=1 Tax=Littorina saxatilis TaxID=31220 RepID=UPI0038B438B6
MAMVFEKCELASASMDAFVGTDYDSDIRSFVEHGHQNNQTFYTDDADLDHLMLKAVQVLRIHLLELEKVSDLCKDFCTRYISCLKGKLQSEHLLRLDDLDSPPLSPASGSGVTDWTVSGGAAVGTLTTTPMMGGGMVMQPGLAMATISQGQIISGNMVYQMVHTPQGIVAQPIQIQPSPLQSAVGTTSVIQGSTPLSQIGMVGSPMATQQTPTNLSMSACLSADDSFDDDDPLGKRRNTKRGVLPKQATQIMKTWLFQHLVHPYPTEDEKRQIASQTNLTLLQVNNWFINARRRILQPMLDNGASSESKAKKNKPVTRPTQKFWPQEIANIQPQLPAHLQQKVTSPSSSAAAAAASALVTAVVTANGQILRADEGTALSLASLPQNLILASQSPPSVAMVTSPGDHTVEDSLILSFNSETSGAD